MKLINKYQSGNQINIVKKDNRTLGDKLSHEISHAIMKWANSFVDNNEIAYDNNGLPRSTFLMNRDAQKRVFESEGWKDVTNKGYGLVNKAVKDSWHWNVPVYQSLHDAIDESKLSKVPGFDYNNYNGSGWSGYVRIDPGHFPVEYAIGPDGRMYNRAWDFNDYKNTGHKWAGDDFNTGGNLINIAGNILDFVGNPVVITSGWLKREMVGGRNDDGSYSYSDRDVSKDLENEKPIYPDRMPESVNKYLNERKLHYEWVPGYGFIPVRNEVVVKSKRKTSKNNKKMNNLMTYAKHEVKLIPRYFQNGGNIRQLQRTLIEKGYLSNAVNSDGSYVEEDGIYGPKTRNAYLKMQADLTPITSQSYLLPTSFISKIEKKVNEHSNEEIINYYHSNKLDNAPYLVDDKINNKLRVYINGKLIREYNAIHGKNSNVKPNSVSFKKKEKMVGDYIVLLGDTLSLIAKKLNVNINTLIKQNNIANPDLITVGQNLHYDTFGYKDTYIDPDEATITYTDSKGNIINGAGNMTTAAGIYYTSKNKKDYHGAPSFMRRTKELVNDNSEKGIPNSIHARIIREGANTNGCTGLSVNDLKDLDNLLAGYDNVPTYVLPANEKNKFLIRNGELCFNSHNNILTPNSYKISYNPIKKISFSSEDLSKDQVNIIKTFSKGLIRNKKSLLKDLGINNDSYNLLAESALGILGVETTFGNENNAVGNFLRAAYKGVFDKDSSAPDYKSKYKTYGLTGDDNSIGLTLIRWKYLSDEAKQLFNKYGITKESTVNDPEKAAIATMIKLGIEYKNSGLNIDRAVKSWNEKPSYLSLVNKYKSRFTIYLDYSTDKNKLVKRKKT